MEMKRYWISGSPTAAAAAAALKSFTTSFEDGLSAAGNKLVELPVT
jgi:hypothetical protein